MKQLLKNTFRKLGYELVTTDHYKRLFDIDTYSEFDCFYLLKKIYGDRSNLVFFDIGANEGQSSIKISKSFPGSAIYTFEPIKNTFDILANNVKNIPTVRPYQLAMGSKSGPTEMIHWAHSQWNTLVQVLNGKGEHHKESETIQVATVDEFCSENSISRIHLLKSDTEGFEKEVMHGAAGMLKNKSIDMYYVEVGFHKEDIRHNQWSDIAKEFEVYGYHFAGLFELSYVNEIDLSYANALFIKDTDLNKY